MSYSTAQLSTNKAHPETPPDAARADELLHALVGRRTGVIRHVGVVEPVDGDAPLVFAGARIANTTPHDAGRDGLDTGGCGSTREAALIAAMCEGVERYCASSYHESRLLGPMPRNGLEVESLDPMLFAAFSDGQRTAGFPFARVDERTPLRWTVGRSLVTGKPIAVPAFAVYLPYSPAPGELMVAPGLSTGLACAGSVGEALTRALCEAIERDAVALHWLRGASPPRIDGGVLRALAADVLPPRDDVRAYDLTTDVGVPVAFVVCRGEGPRGPIVAVGSAADADAAAALRKAAREASQDRAYIRLLIDRDPTWRPAPDFGNVVSFPHHARLYSGRPDLAERAFAFLDQHDSVSTRFVCDKTTPSRDTTDKHDALVQRLSGGGLHGAWIDLTQPWAACLGLHMVKAVVPGLMPLHGRHGLAYVGHPRWRRCADALPHAVVRHTHERWPFPHPMP